MKQLVTACALFLLAVIAGAMLWIAAETHYRACIEAHLVSGAGARVSLEQKYGVGSRADVLTHASIAGCSRLPF